MKPKPGTIVTSIQPSYCGHSPDAIYIVVDNSIGEQYWGISSINDNRIWVSKFNNTGIEIPYWTSTDRFYLNYIPSGQLSELEQLLYGIHV